MPRRLVKALARRLSPFVDEVAGRPWVRRYVPALADPNLWHLNRGSTARGVAVGLFAGLVPGPFQVLAGIALSIALRANFPVAAATTLYTNPLTIVPLYVLAWHVGALFLPVTAEPADLSPPPFDWTPGYLAAVLEWGVGLGKPLALGLPLLALALAALGWAAVRLAWRCHVVRAWRQRQSRPRLA